MVASGPNAISFILLKNLKYLSLERNSTILYANTVNLFNIYNMIKRFESFGGMDYILQTTKEVMYDLPDGYTSNVYVEGERLDVEIMSDSPFDRSQERISQLEGKAEEVAERLSYVIRLCEDEGLKPYLAVILYAKEYSFANDNRAHLVAQKTASFKPEDDAEDKLQRLFGDVTALVSVRMVFSVPSRISTSQEIPFGPEATQVQRVLNILKTLYPIVERTAVWDEEINMKMLRLFSGESSVNLHFTSMGDARTRLLRDLEELDVEDLDASGASINKAIKLFLEPYYKNKNNI